MLNCDEFNIKNTVFQLFIRLIEINSLNIAISQAQKGVKNVHSPLLLGLDKKCKNMNEHCRY